MKKKIAKFLTKEVKSLYMYMTIILGLLIIISSFSYAILEVQTQKNAAVAILISSNPITLTSNISSATTGLTIAAGETIVLSLDVENNAPWELKYRTIYTTTGTVTAKYLTNFDIASGNIGATTEKQVVIILKNTGDSSTTVTFSVEALPTDYSFPSLGANTYAVSTSSSNIEYAYTGSYNQFIVPKTGYYNIEAWGAQGGNSTYGDLTKTGGLGGYTNGKIFLDAGEILYIYIGENYTGAKDALSFNGGGRGTLAVRSGATVSTNSNGGGATDIRYFGVTTPTSDQLAWNSELGLNSRIMVAGGGGGANISDGNTYFNNGGIAGGLYGGSGNVTQLGSTTLTPSGGGTQTLGGVIADGTGYNGSFGIGGYYPTFTAEWMYIAGGGGGYYGGASGNVSSSVVGSAAGGSSFISGYAGANAITSSTSTVASDDIIHYSNKYFIDTEMVSESNTGNGKATITYVGTTSPTRLNTRLNNVRYIKNCINGNSTSTYNQWVEFQAIYQGENIAKGLTATGITNDATYPISNITDGDITSANYAKGTTGNQCVVIDLGSSYNLDEIAVWHYWADGRTYYNNVTSVSSNGSTYVTVIHTEGPETSLGQRVTAWDDGIQYTVANIVTNGSFEDSTTGWSIVGSYTATSSSYSRFGSNSICTNMASNLYSSYIYQTYTFEAGHIYYYKIDHKLVTNTTGTYTLQFKVRTASTQNFTSLTTTELSSGWVKKSVVVDTDDYSDMTYFEMTHGKWLSAASAGMEGSFLAYADGALLVDLTKTFGAGNEPTQTWCDANLDYFDGSTNLYLNY